jgi:exodeoxyribonuclease V alpha subunit
MGKVKGEVKTVTFRDEESGYSVLKVTASSKNPSTVVGILPGLEVGDEVEFNGKWGAHKKFGKQFTAESYQLILPTSIDGLATYLASHIKGIGPVTSKKIVDKFKTDTPKVLENNPQELVKIRGITKSKAVEIGKEWKRNAAVRNQMIKLSSLSISPNLALKIINKYQDKAFETIKKNPYQLAQDIWGVGFIKADTIARKLGFTANSPERIGAGILHVLYKALDNGHLYLPEDKLIEKSQELVNSPSKKIKSEVERLICKKDLIKDLDNSIYIPLYFHTEKKVAKIIKAHQKFKKKITKGNINKELQTIEKEQGFSLNNQQKYAITTTLTNPLTILTGGPGTGKSTTLNALVSILTSKKKKVALAAPTGRAAKRITEITGVEAKTIHRTLKIDKKGQAYYNQDNLLPVDFLIIDEASMLDIILALRVVASIGKGTHLLLVGDDSQLPSVQAGNVLADLINSKTVPVVRLTQIFRQAKKSAIVRNAHKINAGYFPEFPKHPTDFYFFKEEDAEAAAELIVDLVSRRIPQNFSLDPLQDIQVLAPMHKTSCGVAVLNEKLQNKLNPSTQPNMSRYRVHDRIMQTVNNYEKEVFNGEIGTVSSIKKDEEGENILAVDYDGRSVRYKQDELRQTTLAYAVSIHKSQGSEYPAIVMPILTSHYIMLARNLLYTAVTRAKKLVVLVGSKKAIWIALNNNRASRRYTLLSERLKKTSE